MPPKKRRMQKRKGDSSSIAGAEAPSKKKMTKKEQEASLENTQPRAAERRAAGRVAKNAAKKAAPTNEKGIPSRKPKSRPRTLVPIPPHSTQLSPSSNVENANAPAVSEEIHSSAKGAFSSPVQPVAKGPRVSVKREPSWSSSALLLVSYVALFILGFLVFRYVVLGFLLLLHSKVNYKLLMWAYMGYSTWRNVPHWISVAKKKHQEKDANDDLANPVAIIGKLNELQTLVSSKNLEIEVDLPWYKLHACFLSMFHLSAEIRKKHPKHRDELYESCGPSVAREEAEYLRTMLDYAEWAYLGIDNELRANLWSRGYQLLRHDKAPEPGRVGHYIALNHDDRICLIGLKGTSTFSDVLTDVVGTILPHDLDAPFCGDEVNLRCHEGIFTAASMVANDLEMFFRNMVIPQSYRIVICGHSLGAGTACLLGILLRSRFPELQHSPNSDDTNRHALPLEVVAFATPAVLNYTACLACAPFTTSVVNNSDMVPRLSISNLLTVNQGLLEIDRRLEEQGLSPNSLRKAYWYAKDLTKLDEDTLMTVEELDELFLEIHAKDSLFDEHDLYVPGRVVVLFERGEGREVREQEGLEAAVGGVVADGSMKMLRQVELTTSMVCDHFCTSYANNLDDLLRDM